MRQQLSKPRAFWWRRASIRRRRLSALDGCGLYALVIPAGTRPCADGCQSLLLELVPAGQLSSRTGPMATRVCAGRVGPHAVRVRCFSINSGSRCRCQSQNL